MKPTGGPKPGTRPVKLSMARKTAKKSKKTKSQTQPQYVARIINDPGAARYRNLLLDPCGAELEHPLYGGTDGGLLARFTVNLSFGAGATDTAGIFHWTPGCMSTDNHEMVFTAAANATTSVAALGALNAPGKSFLPTNSQGYRVVAACCRVMYPGAEANRSGLVWYGHTNGNLINIGTSYTVANVISNLPYSERTPVGFTDILWKPNQADELWRESGTALGGGENKAQRSAITVAWQNLPAATGVLLQLTCVVEYVPTPALGLAVSSTSRNKSNVPLAGVMNSIADSSWVRSMASAAGMAIANVAGSSTPMTFAAPVLNYAMNRLVGAGGRKIRQLGY